MQCPDVPRGRVARSAARTVGAAPHLILQPVAEVVYRNQTCDATAGLGSPTPLHKINSGAELGKTAPAWHGTGIGRPPSIVLQ